MIRDDLDDRMAEVMIDVVEQILVRLDMEDLLRCKAVCKSWHSLISTPCFVTSHLKHAFNTDRKNHQLGHRRFVSDLTTTEDEWFFVNVIHIVGSYNGLRKKKLPKSPHKPFWRQGVCWGFSYADDDYKVVAGFMINKKWTLFYVLSLKSDTWELIKKVKYTSIDGKAGTLRGGALHWFMEDIKKRRVVILSLDLSTLKFEEIPQPQLGYEYDRWCVRLGVIEECLCISSNPDRFVGIIVIGNPGPFGTDGVVTAHTIVFKQSTVITIHHHENEQTEISE
ncbi:putative F-box domain-containing protein [Helianthus annuus]|nr:putative F-box domain-containing protein [Helianthus annuus]